MTDQNDVTLGEVYRLCQSIEKQVGEQNGHVRKLENDAIRIKTLWTVGVVTAGLLGDSIKHKLGL